MMDLDMDPKRRLGHFDTVVSPTTTSITNHHRNLATETTTMIIDLLDVFKRPTIISLETSIQIVGSIVNG